MGNVIVQQDMCLIIGQSCLSLRLYDKAITRIEEGRAIAKKLGDLVSQEAACCNLGLCYTPQGQYDKAIVVHQQARAILKKLGDRAGEGSTCLNLGVNYEFLGQYNTAAKFLEEAWLIVREVGSQADQEQTLASLGRCKTALGEYAQAIICHTKQWALAQELDHARAQVCSALNMGVALRVQERIEHRHAVDASNMPSAHGCLGAYMCNASRCFETALRLAQTSGFIIEQEEILLHLSFLRFNTSKDEVALHLLKQSLQIQVDNGRHWCRGCGQQRGEDVPMLTCSGCGVARFCNEDHQRMASKKGSGSLRTAVRHKHICPLLKQWRHVVRGKAVAESCAADQLAFLRRDLWWREGPGASSSVLGV